jgi:hypothetical protein
MRSFSVLALGAALFLSACSGTTKEDAAPAVELTESTTVAEDEPTKPEWDLVYSEDFTSAASVADFAFTQPARWKWNDGDDRGSLELLGASDYKPPFRSPTSIALVPNLLVADFDLEVELLQTGRNYGHRDMCLFLGFVSPAKYDYVHMATSPDDRAHNIFRVDGAPRTNLADVAEQGIDWGDGEWHRVRLERRTEPGTIRVFWDGSEEPILEAVDKGFDWGRVGFGSFDDSGRVTGIRVWAPESRSVEEAQPF